MENFKVKWSTQGRGGSFLVSFDQWKNFHISTISGSRAYFDTVIHIVLKIAKEKFGGEALKHNYANPYRCETIHNMSCTKYRIIGLQKKEILRQTVYVPCVNAQIIRSCNNGTGFNWDDRNDCKFLPDLQILADYLGITEQNPEDFVEYFEWRVFSEIPVGFTIPEAPKTKEPASPEEIPDDEKLIID